MRHLNMKWNNNGSILAVTGTQYVRNAQGEEKEISVVQFYNPFSHVSSNLYVGTGATVLSPAAPLKPIVPSLVESTRQKDHFVIVGIQRAPYSTSCGFIYLFCQYPPGLQMDVLCP